MLPERFQYIELYCYFGLFREKFIVGIRPSFLFCSVFFSESYIILMGGTLLPMLYFCTIFLLLTSTSSMTLICRFNSMLLLFFLLLLLIHFFFQNTVHTRHTTLLLLKFLQSSWLGLCVCVSFFQNNHVFFLLLL